MACGGGKCRKQLITSEINFYYNALSCLRTLDDRTKTMDRNTDTANDNTDAAPQQEMPADKMIPGFPGRLIAGLRIKIRRLFKKEDPNIYPFF